MASAGRNLSFLSDAEEVISEYLGDKRRLFKQAGVVIAT